MKKIQGKNINLRTTEVEDAAFILQLRMLEHKNQYLSQVDNDLEKQQDWLKQYKNREEQKLEYYFISRSHVPAREWYLQEKSYKAAGTYTPRNGHVVTQHELWYHYASESSN